MNKQSQEYIIVPKIKRPSYLPHILFKGKKVCVLTNYRTGSTFFIQETFLTNRIAPTGDWEYFNDDRDFDFALNQLKIPNKLVFKMMPDHIDHSPVKLSKIATVCDEFMYLYRRDFDAQAKSWIAWNVSGDHEHHWGEMKEYDIQISQADADVYIQQLIDNYKSMKFAYKNYPGKVFCLEDFPVQTPYDRKYTWLNDIKIPAFNVNKEVFRN